MAVALVAAAVAGAWWYGGLASGLIATLGVLVALALVAVATLFMRRLAARRDGQLRRLEARLSEKDRLLREMCAIARIGAWNYDPTTGAEDWTDEAARIFDVNPVALQRAVFGLASFAAVERQRFKTALGMAADCNRSFELELELTTITARRKWVRVIGFPVLERDRVVRVHGSIQDISERKESDNTLRSVLDAARDGIALVDTDGIVRMWNTAAERIFGYKTDEILGRHLLHTVTPARSHRLCDARFVRFRRSRPDPQSHGRTLEFVAVHRLGHEFPLEVSFSALQLGGNWHCVGVLRDISRRKNAEESLRKLSLAVEQSTSGIVITDLSANIEYVNQAFCDMTGYGSEELLGRNPRVLNSGRLPPEAYESLWKALLAGEVWKGEFINRRKSGEEYVQFSHVSPIRRDGGAITHYLAIGEDITERKRIGEELDRHRHHLLELVAERTAQLEEARAAAVAASQAKSAFLANVSHEIRTPMTAIVGVAHLLRRAGLTPAQAELLRKIDGAAEHLLSVINDVLDLSKIEAGKLLLDESDVDVGAVLADVVAIVSPRAEAKKVAMAVDAEPLPRALRGDPTRLKQALLNYVSNAVKFSEQGVVSVRARCISEEAEEMVLRFEVEDQGIGIEPSRLVQLFAPFQQADLSTARRYGGTGLGLTITRGLAELMGGEAGATSVPGAGSRFWFTVRLRKHPSASESAPAAFVQQAAEAVLALRYVGRRVLLVEDDAVNQEIAVELLGFVGLMVDVASDGSEAVAMVQESAYELILMDMEMPTLNGLDATRRIRLLPGGARVPIIAMTANAFADDRQRCFDAGMSDFIAKPFTPETLYGTVLRFLGEEPSAGR